LNNEPEYRRALLHKSHAKNDGRLFCTPGASMKKPLLAMILGLCIPLFCLGGTGSNPTALEKQLLEALKVDDTGEDRRGDPGWVINNYAAEHLIDDRRTERVDFDDYYVLRKPAKLLGHDLLVISWGHGRDDTVDGPTGCCVYLGLTVYVRVNGDDANLARFAKTNRCSYEPNEDVLGFWKQMNEHPPIRFPKGRYASMACTDQTLHDW
jgi:hypothetical protein